MFFQEGHPGVERPKLVDQGGGEYSTRRGVRMRKIHSHSGNYQSLSIAFGIMITSNFSLCGQTTLPLVAAVTSLKLVVSFTIIYIEFSTAPSFHTARNLHLIT